MKRLLKPVMVLLFLVLSGQALAVIETYQFSSDAHQQRYQQLVDELRCPKCQNQNLAGSNSPIAADLRRELHRMIEAGQDDATIKAFMVSRYGNFILYRPPVDHNTIILWSLPGLLALLAMVTVLVYRRRLEKAAVAGPLTEAEQQRLAAILDRYR